MSGENLVHARRRRLRYVTAVTAIFLLALGTVAMADHFQDRDTLAQHCPDHNGHPNKVNNPAPGSVHKVTVDGTDVWLHFSDDLESVEFFADEAGTTPIAVDFCIKAGDRAGGEETGTEGHVSWETQGGQVPDISYVVVYRLAGECPPGQVRDTGTNECVDPCPDGSAPHNGECPEEPCPPGQVRDTGTNECVDPCPDGNTPHNGECPVDPQQQAFCRAVLIQILGTELFEANPDSDPCADDDAGLLYEILSAIGLTGSDLGGFIFFTEDGKIVLTDGSTGSITLDLLYSRTRGDASSGHAEAGIASLSIASDEEQIGLEVGTSTDSTDCDGTHSHDAKLVELRLAGMAIGIPGEHTVIPADPLLNLHIEDKDDGRNEGPDDTGSQAVDAEALAGAVTAAVADSESGCE